MKKILFQIRDTKANVCLDPFACYTDSEMRRSVAISLSSSELPVAKYPDDYEVWKIGEFSTDKPGFSVCDPVCLGTLRVVAGAPAHE